MKNILLGLVILFAGKLLAQPDTNDFRHYKLVLTSTDSVLYLVSQTPTTLYKFDLIKKLFIDSIKVNNSTNDGFEVSELNWKGVTSLIVLKEAREYCGGGYIRHYLLDIDDKFLELISVKDYIDEGGPGADFSSSIEFIGDTLIYTMEEEKLKLDSLNDNIRDYNDVEIEATRKKYVWDFESNKILPISFGQD